MGKTLVNFLTDLYTKRQTHYLDLDPNCTISFESISEITKFNQVKNRKVAEEGYIPPEVC